MRKRVLIAVLLMVMLIAACPASQTGTATSGQNFLTTAETTKTVAEDTLYYARVYYNLGKINEAQFKSVKDAYDILYLVQSQLIDARIAYLKVPTDATADQKYRALMAEVMLAQQKLVLLAFKLGIVGDEKPPEIPIRK